MYLGVYRFDGRPATLLAAYQRLLQGMPTEKFGVHVCVERADGIDVYDTCPTREVFDAFAASADFGKALAQAGLPAPQVARLGETRTVIARGHRVE